MAKVYYSSVLDVPAEAVWAVVRNFNNYPAYIDGVTESRIEDGRSGDAVGAVRSFAYHDLRVRQRLLALSDIECFFSYGSCEPFAFPGSGEDVEPIDYEGTLRVSPVVATGQSFVEWWVSFEGGAADRARWTEFFAAGLREWMASLAAHAGDAQPGARPGGAA
jgi:hypothetical protein